ncbi:Probable transmembrane hypothetical protein [Tenacibaculum maritimum]|uniref:hypothetical protein n=2 Tax=Tenacibaculum maritimum TaxID=107401 RepID=UPI0012E6ECBE|nr:hypothetical protein [Tenacibaculum maritimum]CAA0159755.1 Probable transmembrane hypothetical protein [Tenacibaculum maritimum]CAA0163910.1 Probable transmembrane hypothetical protein [Tenacibaculum maritimum]CAA0165877.1 Probable transmembrane hypothetical protein [Tenacibaculum maritimum]
MEYLKKIITVKPREITREDIESSNDFTEEASDLYYREKITARGWMSWIIGIILVLMSLIGLVSDDVVVVMGMLMSFGLPGVLTIIYGFVAPIKYQIYDRMNGIITVTRVFRSSVAIPFSSGYGLKGYSNTSPGVISAQLNFVSSKKKPRVGGIIAHNLVEDSWSFMVWYMDKNRPLPPGSAFDAYREQDYQRRKAAGFPKPLYPSKIATPEATKEQQAARKRIGGW